MQLKEQTYQSISDFNSTFYADLVLQGISVASAVSYRSVKDAKTRLKAKVEETLLEVALRRQHDQSAYCFVQDSQDRLAVFRLEFAGRNENAGLNWRYDIIRPGKRGGSCSFPAANYDEAVKLMREHAEQMAEDGGMYLGDWLSSLNCT